MNCDCYIDLEIWTYFFSFQQCYGKKDVIIDEELLRPFDRFAGVSLLKVGTEIEY